MEIEATPVGRAGPKPAGERRGPALVHIGPGKGKRTAAFGLALPAHGRGQPVRIHQFMVPSVRFGEHRVFESPGMPVEGAGDGFGPARDRGPMRSVVASVASVASVAQPRRHVATSRDPCGPATVCCVRTGSRSATPCRPAGPARCGCPRDQPTRSTRRSICRDD